MVLAGYFNKFLPNVTSQLSDTTCWNGSLSSVQAMPHSSDSTVWRMQTYESLIDIWHFSGRFPLSACGWVSGRLESIPTIAGKCGDMKAGACSNTWLWKVDEAGKSESKGPTLVGDFAYECSVSNSKSKRGWDKSHEKESWECVYSMCAKSDKIG